MKQKPSGSILIVNSTLMGNRILWMLKWNSASLKFTFVFLHVVFIWLRMPLQIILKCTKKNKRKNWYKPGRMRNILFSSSTSIWTTKYDLSKRWVNAHLLNKYLNTYMVSFYFQGQQVLELLKYIFKNWWVDTLIYWIDN